MDAPPLVDPRQDLLDGYTISLPFPMARRVEDGSLVFWHTPQGLTFWISATTRPNGDDPLDEWRRARSPEGEDELSEREGSLVRYGYRLVEDAGDSRQPAFYGFVAEGTRQFLVAAYFNSPEMIGEVMETWRSVRKVH